MKKEFNIAIVGLGQIGIFLYNEIKRNITAFIEAFQYTYKMFSPNPKWL